MKNSKEIESAVCDSCCVSNMNVSVCFAPCFDSCLIRFVSCDLECIENTTLLNCINTSNITVY
jgi:hypothetical protein